MLFKKQVRSRKTSATCEDGRKRVVLPGGKGWKCVFTSAEAQKRSEARVAAAERNRQAEEERVVAERAARAANAALHELDSLEEGVGYEQYEERVREQLDDEHGINVDNVHSGVP